MSARFWLLLVLLLTLGGVASAQSSCRFQASQFASSDLRPNLQSIGESVPGIERSDEVSIIWDARERRNRTNFIDVPRFGVLENARRSIGRLHILFTSSSNGQTCMTPCSAVLISDRHILTNRHCAVPHLYPNTGIKSPPEQFGVVLGHLSDNELGEFFQLKSTPVEVSEDTRADYAILEISEGTFPRSFRPAQFSKEVPSINDPIFIVSHPSGFRMQTDPNCSGAFVNRYLFSHNCHSTGGSSGSAVFNERGEVIALHFAGGLDSGGGRNKSLPIATIAAMSPTFGRLISPNRPTDDAPDEPDTSASNDDFKYYDGGVKISYSDGSEYLGGARVDADGNGVPHGSGIYTHSRGQTSGEWSEGRRDGRFCYDNNIKGFSSMKTFRNDQLEGPQITRYDNREEHFEILNGKLTGVLVKIYDSGLWVAFDAEGAEVTQDIGPNDQIDRGRGEPPSYAHANNCDVNSATFGRGIID